MTKTILLLFRADIVIVNMHCDYQIIGFATLATASHCLVLCILRE